jgi:beta-phosphoglucomutase-like phosphatase (HAD superfamily)
LVRAAEAERPRCVASSSRLDRIRLSLDVAGLAGHFDPDHLFSTQMVARPKPAPDVFILAAEKLGAEPSRCVVVEDSPHGVHGALAAGMVPVGLTAAGHGSPTLAGRLSEAGAIEVFGSVEELGAWLGLDGAVAQRGRT